MDENTDRSIPFILSHAYIGIYNIREYVHERKALPQ